MFNCISFDQLLGAAFAPAEFSPVGPCGPLGKETVNLSEPCEGKLAPQPVPYTPIPCPAAHWGRVEIPAPQLFDIEQLRRSTEILFVILARAERDGARKERKVLREKRLAKEALIAKIKLAARKVREDQQAKLAERMEKVAEKLAEIYRASAGALRARCVHKVMGASIPIILPGCAASRVAVIRGHREKLRLLEDLRWSYLMLVEQVAA